MKALLLLAAVALVSCDSPEPAAPTIDQTKFLREENADLKKKVAKLEHQLTEEKALPKVPLGEESALRFSRLISMSQDLVTNEEKKSDREWLETEVYRSLRVYYHDRKESDLFDDWRRPFSSRVRSHRGEK